MTYYIKIDSPRQFRRDLLENSKKVISCLQDYRNVAFIRQRKKQLMQSLQAEVKEISLLVAQLDKIMPEKHLREEAVQEAKEAEKKKNIAAKLAIDLVKKSAQEAQKSQLEEMERARKESVEAEKRVKQRAKEDLANALKVSKSSAKKSSSKKAVSKKSVKKSVQKKIVKEKIVSPALPDIKESKVKEPVNPTIVAPKTPSVVAVSQEPKTASEMDRLNDALASIEKKLAQLK